MIHLKSIALRRESAQAQLLLLPLAALAPIAAFLTLPLTRDMTHFLLPWMEHVLSGGLGSLSGEFSNYSPPYIYLMYLASWLVPLIGEVAAIKLISLPFVLLLSLGLYDLVLGASGDRTKALAAACTAWLLPTLLANAFVWGQADTIYTAFLIWFVAFAARGRPAAAAVAFGFAVAFKAQAMLVAPVLLYLLLSRTMALRHLALIPATYAALMVPAVLAGRPILDCFTVYFGQFERFGSLAMTAPNPWQFSTRFVPYEVGVAFGLPAAAAVGAALAITSARLRPSPQSLLLVAAACAAAMPYVLPKMHERFFFPADVLALALAFALPRYWSAAVLLQTGTLLAYMHYLAGVDRAAQWAVAPVTAALGVLLFALWEAHRGRDRVPEHAGPAPAAQGPCREGPAPSEPRSRS
jgi:Gpi18-like mannosyltransferase